MFQRTLFKIYRSSTNYGAINSIRGLQRSTIQNLPKQLSKNIASPALANKYEVITEQNIAGSETVQSLNYDLLSDEFDDINLQRGKTGVFEVEHLVELLKRENAKDIFVAVVAKEINFVEYICIASARSKRHILALAEFVRKVYKRKCSKHDYIPSIEGKTSDEWMALDLGNIALHIFSEKTRIIYDLETLWAVGPKYDDQTNKKSDEVVEILENYSTYLKDLKPLA